MSNNDMVSLRLDEDTRRKLDELMLKMNMTRTDVIRYALEQLAQKAGVK